MDKKKRTNIPDGAVAPGIDPDDSYGEKAAKEEIENKKSTPVTRLVYDEYDQSGK